MSYETVIAGLAERFRAVPGLATKPILAYEPTSIQATPTLYMLLDRVERSQHGQVTAMRYRILCRLVINWVDNERAEEELIPYVNAIPAAIDADARLGERLPNGLAQVDDMQATFVSIGGVLYRALDTYANVLEKAPFKSGI